MKGGQEHDPKKTTYGIFGFARSNNFSFEESSKRRTVGLGAGPPTLVGQNMSWTVLREIQMIDVRARN